MRIFFFYLLLVVFVAPPYPGRCREVTENDPDVMRYLPDDSELAGWSALGDPQFARGEDLYLMIDGGAEIFLEYGFKHAVIQSYRSEKGRTVNLEIYEMEDPSSAYGIYTFRTGEGGKEISIGSDGRIEDYYLNFWKGNLLVTVIGFDSDEETVEGVEKIARAVEVRIKGEGRKPRLSGLLPSNGLRPNGIEYLKGNLALYNNYEFDSADIFGLSEGVIGAYADHRTFIFSYEDEAECRKWFLNGVNHLRSGTAFHDLTRYENGYTMRDDGGNHLRMEVHRSFIILVLGAEDESEDLMAEQKDVIDRSNGKVLR